MRARTKRRERDRLRAKELAEVRRHLPPEIRDRMAAVAAAVDPSAPVFWHVFRSRLAARETFRPIANLDEARDIAAQVLKEQGFDMTGIILKPFWQPPAMVFGVVPEHGLAVEAVEAGRATARGQSIRRRLAAI